MSGSQVNLAWTASTDNVARRELPGRALPGRRLHELRPGRDADRHDVQRHGADAATTYRYRVRAADAAGNLSGYTDDPGDATTPDTQPPTDPTGLTATADLGEPDQPRLDGLDRQRRAHRLPGRALPGRRPARTSSRSRPRPATTYSDTGLAAATTYRYRVRAADAAGNLSGYTAIQNATTPDTQAPTEPTGLTATAVSQSQINLAWTGSTDNVALTSYRVERCQGAGCTNFVQVATPTATTLQRHRPGARRRPTATASAPRTRPAT